MYVIPKHWKRNMQNLINDLSVISDLQQELSNYEKDTM